MLLERISVDSSDIINSIFDAGICGFASVGIENVGRELWKCAAGQS